jgi:hypothetical protein
VPSSILKPESSSEPSIKSITSFFNVFCLSFLATTVFDAGRPFFVSIDDRFAFVVLAFLEGAVALELFFRLDAVFVSIHPSSLDGVVAFDFRLGLATFFGRGSLIRALSEVIKEAAKAVHPRYTTVLKLWRRNHDKAKKAQYGVSALNLT